MKINVAGVMVDNLSKEEVISEIDNIIKSEHNSYIVTPYSEMVVFALNDNDYLKALNSSRLSLPDGIGILWAAHYLSSKSHHLFTSLAAIILSPKAIRTVFKEKISGSLFVYDLARLASEKNYSLALVGGVNNVATLAGNELKRLYPNLRIKLSVSDRPFDDKIIKEINESNSDILLLAYSPPKQEKWLFDNHDKLNIRVALGLGGTFDYLAGIRLPAPKFMHHMGLEWLWRLITQPWRIKRMWSAVPIFIWKIYKFKQLYAKRS